MPAEKLAQSGIGRFTSPVHQEQATKNGSALTAHEDACARVAARFSERWLRVYAGRKLRRDPIYAAAFQLLRDSNRPLVDVGCGVGLLAFYLRERDFLPPISGFDADGRKIARANSVAQGGAYPDLNFFEHDVCEPIGQTGNIVLFDLLHYLQPNDQTRLLERLAARIAPGGILVIRDCPRDGNARSWLTKLAERFAQITTWNMKAALYFPTREQIFAPFAEARFSRTVAPLWGRTPFNNHLFVFRRRAGATVPA
jgi:2-polyprenyl-3-methyl-5-hydroxy-6-metoxy-1,4-benzoquinol methylase